jgi:hypothetical protein
LQLRSNRHHFPLRNGTPGGLSFGGFVGATLVGRHIFGLELSTALIAASFPAHF